MMTILSVIICVAVVITALSLAAYMISCIVSSIKLNKQQSASEGYFAKMQKMLYRLDEPGGQFLVTKVWYSDGHKSSNIVSAASPEEAYKAESDDRRNLDYYIESISKL